MRRGKTLLAYRMHTSSCCLRKVARHRFDSTGSDVEMGVTVFNSVKAESKDEVEKRVERAISDDVGLTARGIHKLMDSGDADQEGKKKEVRMCESRKTRAGREELVANTVTTSLASLAAGNRAEFLLDHQGLPLQLVRM